LNPSNPTFSFVIPVYNEELYIARTLESIFKLKSHNYTFEVVVVDNGSTDDTTNIVTTFPVQALLETSGTIAKVRNIGTQRTRGKFLVFLDGDVSLTDAWINNIETAINQLSENALCILGSRCLPENDVDFLNKHWFKRLAEYKSSYVNSGHLITTKALFDKLSGFDESLSTAEDYDFCMRAREQGALVENWQQLEVIHYGYPSTIKKFIQRERWHGSEDFQSASKILNSKMAWAALANLAVFIASVVLAISTNNLLWLACYLLWLVGTSIALTLVKFGHKEISSTLATACVFAVYLTGRTAAIFTKRA